MSKQPAALKTPFYNFHLKAGGKMVDFAGYSMPVQYPQGIIDEHLQVRSKAGLFDVSHMGQIVVKGSTAQTNLEKLMPIDLDDLSVNQLAYTFLTTENGTILDDLIVTRLEHDTFSLVVNGACKHQDFAHLQAHLPDVELTLLEGYGLLAVQGPKAAEVLATLAPTSNSLRFMQGAEAVIGGANCYITRSGYTGEDGFEISIKPNDCQTVAELLLSNQWVQWIGLGARDTLRMEAGLCLYGHDLDLQTSPVEAGLSWSISKTRRIGGTKEGGFLGADTILHQIADGASKKRVAFVVDGRAPVREGAEIVDASGNCVGTITSGGFAPSLQQPIAMGYISSQFAQNGQALNALVRGKPRTITITSMPLVPHRYYRG